MGWEDKVKVNHLLLFCADWRTRSEIREKFKMSNIQSWHCVRFLSNLNHDVITEKKVGATKRAYRYKTRIRSVQKIKADLKILKDAPAMVLKSKESIEALTEKAEKPIVEKPIVPVVKKTQEVVEKTKPVETAPQSL